MCQIVFANRVKYLWEISYMKSLGCQAPTTRPASLFTARCTLDNWVNCSSPALCRDIVKMFFRIQNIRRPKILLRHRAIPRSNPSCRDFKNSNLKRNLFNHKFSVFFALIEHIMGRQCLCGHTLYLLNLIIDIQL
jgi:hypothetical protein